MIVQRVCVTAFALFITILSSNGGPPGCCHGAEPANKLNIVYVLADDLGYGDVRCYNPMSKIPTPNVDRLAAEGLRFTDAHSASAVCSPTRYGILTGRYCWRTRLQSGVLGPYDPPLIERERLTVAKLLQRHGYHTACVGKWHLGWDWPRQDGNVVFDRAIASGPTTRGFDTYFGTDVPNYPPYCFLANDRTLGQPTAQKEMRDLNGRPGPMLPDWKFDAILPTLAEKAVAYIGERAADKKPFFLYFPLTSPHEPIAPSERFRGKSGISELADFLMETDWAVGEVLKALDQHGLNDNTLVVFTSDNGHAPYTGLPALLKAGHMPSGPLRGYKGDIWEGGHRVPFVVRWPGTVKPGTVCEATICHNNLLATCAALLAVPVPVDAGEDSFSILPLLRGEQPAEPTHPAIMHHSVSGQFAIRRGPWKLVNLKAHKPRPGEQPKDDWQLFDLRNDLAEKENVAEKHPHVVQELQEQLAGYQKNGRSRPRR